MLFKVVFILHFLTSAQASDHGLEILRKSLLSSKDRAERLHLLKAYKIKIAERLKASDLNAIEQDVYFSQIDVEKGNCATYLKDVERVRGDDRALHQKIKEIIEITCEIEK